jgi:ELWxxDGT repeat protein
MKNQRIVFLLLLVGLITAVLVVTGVMEVRERTNTVNALPLSDPFPKPYRVKDINSTSYSSMIHCPVVLGEKMLCSARDPQHGFELWESNGKWNGAYLIKDLAPGYGDTYALNGFHARLNN